MVSHNITQSKSWLVLVDVLVVVVRSGGISQVHHIQISGHTALFGRYDVENLARPDQPEVTSTQFLDRIKPGLQIGNTGT